MACIIAVCMCIPVFADTETASVQDSAGNILISGDNVLLPSAPFFGAFAAGKTVDLNSAESEGSVFAAGQNISASGASIGESLYVAGNGIMLNNVDVQGNIFAAGSDLSLIGESQANGVYMAGSKITFEGETNALCLAAEEVSVKGYIHGDVSITADNVEIGNGTVILGKLEVVGSKEPVIPEDAQIGDFEFSVKSEAGEDAAEAAAKLSIGSMILKKIGSCFYWIIAMAAFGMILCWLFNDHLQGAVDMIKTRTSGMILAGVIGYLCIPIAALILCVTCIFAPIAGLLMLAYVLLLCAGLAFTGASLARLVFPNMNRFLSALIGIAVLEAVRLIPVIGFLVAVAADMYLVGYVIVALWDNRLKRKSSAEVISD